LLAARGARTSTLEGRPNGERTVSRPGLAASSLSTSSPVASPTASTPASVSPASVSENKVSISKGENGAPTRPSNVSGAPTKARAKRRY
jgi:hypothetical protein